MKDFVDIVGQVVTVALIVLALRWLFVPREGKARRLPDGSNSYQLKWQFRAIGLGATGVGVIIGVGIGFDSRSVSDWVVWPFLLAFVVGGICLASGSVTTNKHGVIKKALWHSSSFRWEEITEVRQHRKQGGAIELRAGKRKMIVDYLRFNGVNEFLTEVANRTKIPPMID